MTCACLRHTQCSRIPWLDIYFISVPSKRAKARVVGRKISVLFHDFFDARHAITRNSSKWYKPDWISREIRAKCHCNNIAQPNVIHFLHGDNYDAGDKPHSVHTAFPVLT